MADSINYQLAKFVASYGKVSQIPESTCPEVSFVGRSNVGKSSIMNKLFGRKNLVKVSSTPGKTSNINFFEADDVHFVDLPGYGFARRSKAERDRWAELIGDFFDSERSFNLVVSLVDIRHDPSKLDHDMIEASALVTGLYCAKNGVTFVIDHHASPFHLDGSLETIAKALDRVGLGHLLCYEISCRDGEGIKEKGLAETDAFLSSGRKGHVGLHASFTVDDDLLGRAVDLARKHKTGVHIHVAEGIEDQEHCARTYGKSVVRRLSDAGVLDLPLSILGHCVHLDAEERDLIRTSPCWVVQN